MIFGIVGTITDDHPLPIRGNGKSATLTYYGYQDYKSGINVYSNFHTSFSKFISMNQLVELFETDQLKNAVVLIDEAQIYFPKNMKAKTIEVLINGMIAQSRKDDLDFYIATQRYKNLHRELRVHIDEYIVPEKRHLDGSQCFKDKCREKHIILVYNARSLEHKPITQFKAWVVGGLYNTREKHSENFDYQKYLEWREKFK